MVCRSRTSLSGFGWSANESVNYPVPKLAAVILPVASKVLELQACIATLGSGSFKDIFVEIQFIYHKVYPFKIYNPVFLAHVHSCMAIMISLVLEYVIIPKEAALFEATTAVLLGQSQYSMPGFYFYLCPIQPFLTHKPK